MGMPNQYTGPVDPALRFWPKVDKTAGCWLWTAGTDSNGYGVFTIGGRALGAHRVSYEWTYGSVPDDLNVLHRCDVRACVRPDHLFLGTNADNSRDMVSKGRAASGDRNSTHIHPEMVQGERNGRARLTGADVLEIRRLYAAGGIRQVDLAKRFGVPQVHISRIVLRQSWKHI
jgi:predicted DNA-binding protein (UPF0251 family)